VVFWIVAPYSVVDVGDSDGDIFWGYVQEFTWTTEKNREST
jgi:hypothetical protein